MQVAKGPGIFWVGVEMCILVVHVRAARFRLPNDMIVSFIEPYEWPT